MKIAFVKFLGIIILASILSSKVIEPAICHAHEDVASQQQETGPCCMVCHPAHHQAIIPANSQIDLVSLGFAGRIERLNISLLDSPPSSIFHPPQGLPSIR